MKKVTQFLFLGLLALSVSLAPAHASTPIEAAPTVASVLSVKAMAPVQIAVVSVANLVAAQAIVPCGPTGQGVAMCYYGLTICVPAWYVPRYQSIGAQLGVCPAVVPR